MCLNAVSKKDGRRTVERCGGVDLKLKRVVGTLRDPAAPLFRGPLLLPPHFKNIPPGVGSSRANIVRAGRLKTNVVWLAMQGPFSGGGREAQAPAL